MLQAATGVADVVLSPMKHGCGALLVAAGACTSLTIFLIRLL